MSSPLAIGFDEAPWRFGDAWCHRVTDGDTQTYKSRHTIELPREKVTVEREWVVRLLETDSEERRNDYEAWLAEKAYSERFLFDEQPGGLLVARNVLLVLTGRVDVYGRWLGWAVANGGLNLSYELNREFGREAEPLEAQTMRLTGVTA